MVIDVAQNVVVPLLEKPRHVTARNHGNTSLVPEAKPINTGGHRDLARISSRHLSRILTRRPMTPSRCQGWMRMVGSLSS